MLSNRFLKVILHPFFIGLILTVALFVLSPPWFSKYRIKEMDVDLLMGNFYSYFDDLNYDGISEEIFIDLNNPLLPKFQLIEENRIINSCNLNRSVCGSAFYSFGNYNDDLSRELYVFTTRNDSVFLNILNFLSGDPYVITDRYIDSQQSGDEAETPFPGIIGFYDYDSDKNKELVFYINTGYREQPRNCYIYNIVKDSLLKSPKSGAALVTPTLFDLNHDSIPEILFSSTAPGNMDPSFPYSDHKGWLMAFDKDLRFVFEPVPFESHPCHVSVLPVDFGHYIRLIVLKYYFGKDTISSTLNLFNEKGNNIAQHKLNKASGELYILPGTETGTFFLLGYKSSIAELMDTAFSVLKEVRIPELRLNTATIQMDVDGDERKDYIFKGYETGRYYVAPSDLSSFTPFNIGTDPDPWIFFSSLRQSKNQPPLLFVALSKRVISYSYAVNKLYRFRYLIYSAVYVLISGILYVIYMMQRYLARMQFENRRKMNELQLRSVKSQMDPHFTFNILNSIGSLYSQSDKRKTADYLFGKYAKLLRETIVTSDQTEVTLEQELDFVKNYLDIEKFRIDSDFAFSIETGDEVDTSIKIPRMLIHTFAENAVKYAVRQVESGARLDILVRKIRSGLLITLVDNGPGLKGNHRTLVAGTGKGLAIVDEMIRLYHEMTGVKIGYSIDEVAENGKCRGTRVEIWVNLKS